MKRFIITVVSIFVLSGCTILNQKPPEDLLNQVNSTDALNFKIVDSYKFKLNDTDELNGTTERWCIATIQSAKNALGLYSPLGMAWYFVKVNGSWESLDLMVFDEYEQYSAKQTSCEFFKDKY